MEAASRPKLNPRCSDPDTRRTGNRLPKVESSFQEPHHHLEKDAAKDRWGKFYEYIDRSIHMSIHDYAYDYAHDYAPVYEYARAHVYTTQLLHAYATH